MHSLVKALLFIFAVCKGQLLKDSQGSCVTKIRDGICKGGKFISIAAMSGFSVDDCRDACQVKVSEECGAFVWGKPAARNRKNSGMCILYKTGSEKTCTTKAHYNTRYELHALNRCPGLKRETYSASVDKRDALEYTEYEKSGCYSADTVNGVSTRHRFSYTKSGMFKSKFKEEMEELVGDCATSTQVVEGTLTEGARFFMITGYQDCYALYDLDATCAWMETATKLSSSNCYTTRKGQCDMEQLDVCVGKYNPTLSFIYAQPGACTGGWSDWTSYTECTANCGGGGKKVRTRSCTNPTPARGYSCDGESSETADCGEESCHITPVDGGLSQWTDYSCCSVMSSGGGHRVRSRACDSPAPSGAGNDCEGELTEIEACDAPSPAPVNGGLSGWSDYTECSAECDGGLKIRTRTCTEPAPENGGENCEGDLYETETCNDDACTDV